MILIFKSTMLPENLSFTVDTDDEDYGDVLEAAEEAYVQHGAQAEWRVIPEDADDGQRWMLDHFSSNLFQFERMKVLIESEIEGWNDIKEVMAVHYSHDKDDADDLIRAVKAEEWQLEYDSDEGTAYKDWAISNLDGELDLPSQYEDYFDYEQYGRDHAEHCIKYHDGDFYVFNEWH